MLVNDVSVEAHTIGLWDSIADSARKMRVESVGCLVVVNSGKVVGLISERDIALGCPVEGHNPWDCKVYKHMKIQSATVSPRMNTSMVTIAMMDHDTDCMPVVDNGKLVGVVMSEDIAAANERQFAYDSEVFSLAGAD